MAEEQATETSAETKQNSPQFAVDKIFIKDLSFETPLGIESFTQKWKPTVNQDVSTKINAVGSDRYEVVLTVTASLKDKESEKTIYLVEVQQAGLFMVKGVEQGVLPQLLNTQCPALLFPYAREVVDNTVVKGGFPPLNLPPINFDALFFQAVRQAKEKAEKEQATQH